MPEKLEIVAQDSEQSTATRLDEVGLTVDFEHDRHASRTTGARLRSSSGVGSAGAPRHRHPGSRPRACSRPAVAARRTTLRARPRRRARRRPRRRRPRRRARTVAPTSPFQRRARTVAPRSRRSASIPSRRTSSSSRPTVARSRSRSTRRKAPATSASLVSLAKSGFYDDTIFHRIVPGFVIQGGDPTQAGNGGPGYSTVDPPPADSTYTEGRRRDGQDGRRARRNLGQPVLRRQRPERLDAAAGLRDRRQRDERHGRSSSASTASATQMTRNGTPTRPVVIESVTVEES